MLTPFVLANPPLDHAVKKTASAASAGETVPGTESAGFDKLLAQEIGNRPDMHKDKPGDKNTTMEEGGESRMAATGDSGPADASVNGSKGAAGPENTKKSDSASEAISILPQFMDFANMLPASMTGQSMPVLAETSASTRAHAHMGHGLDAQAAGIQDYGQSKDEAGWVSRRKAETAADSLTGVSQAEQEGITTGYVALGGQPISLIPGNAAEADAGPRPGPRIRQWGAPQIAGMPVGIPADVLSGVMAGVQKEGTGAGGSAALQNVTSVRLDADARQDSLRHLELTSMDATFANEPGKLPNISADVVPQNFSAIQAEAALSTVPIERGLALASIAAASSPDHSLTTLGPRLGSADWNDALGQKIIWMVSQQQQIAELSLNPPGLGPLQIVLSVNNDQASAMFVSQNADVRQTLEAALPRLKEMMADSGISLGSTTISSDSSQQGALAEGFERRNHSGARYAGDSSPAVSDSDRAGIAGISIHGMASLVDTFA